MRNMSFATPLQRPDMTVRRSIKTNLAVASKKCKASNMCCAVVAPDPPSLKSHKALYRASSVTLRRFKKPPVLSSRPKRHKELARFCKVEEAFILKQSAID